jgi:allantoinase
MFVDVAFWGGLVPQNAHNASILEDLLAQGVVGLKAFMSPAGTEDFDQSSVKDIKAAAASLAKFNAPLMVHAELPPKNDASSTTGKDPRKYSTYMNSRPRKWEKVCLFVSFSFFPRSLWARARNSESMKKKKKYGAQCKRKRMMKIHWC